MAEPRSGPRLLKAGIVDVDWGLRVTVVEPCNLYGCRLGDDVFVGPFVEVQRNCTVGPRTRIQSHAFLCEGVTVGADCFIGHGVMFINDAFRTGGPARGRTELWETTTVGDSVSIGSNATILPVSICAGSVIGAGSVVTRDIDRPGVYAGNPARFLRSI